jgi:hypothetical protein
LRLALLPLLFSLTVISLFPPAWQEAERRRVREIEAPEADWLPVLVFTPEDVDVVWYGELHEYTQAHRDYSFLAPDGQDELLSQKLVTSYRRMAPTGDAFPKFKAKQLSPGRQSVEVGFHGDGDLIVWYEAKEKEIEFRRYMRTGPLFPFIPLFWSVLISVVLWGAAYGLWRIYTEARKAV